MDKQEVEEKDDDDDDDDEEGRGDPALRSTYPLPLPIFTLEDNCRPHVALASFGFSNKK